MPASMMIACVALSPKVTGNRMEMPASGPMPGSTPTSVPTRQPRNAYHALAGCKATEKPRYRLWSVVSTAVLESEGAGFERCLERVDEQNVGGHDDPQTEDGCREQFPPLDDDEQRKDQQHVGGEEA